MKLACDAMLGKLARWLRILGFDTILFDSKTPDAMVTKKSKGRILLTRDKRLARQPKAVYVLSHDIEGQLQEVFGALKLKSGFPRGTRCPLCNGKLTRTARPISIPERVRSCLFWRCQKCGHAYWRGSHWVKITRTAEQLHAKKGIPKCTATPIQQV
ncbi:Mut7-C RNAse domain-containing protein [Candidatus Micrarchaeota archaeon]|nr:Mut7-C RNAse domain-containing protein [Candidatus Micrarchaeota archaeon]